MREREINKSGKNNKKKTNGDTETDEDKGTPIGDSI